MQKANTTCLQIAFEEVEEVLWTMSWNSKIPMLRPTSNLCCRDNSVSRSVRRLSHCPVADQ